MRIDIPPNESWNAVSEQIRAALPFQDVAVQVQAYAGYQHALYEATQGLARLFSHKKTIAILEPAEPAIEQIAIAFSEDAFTVKKISQSQLEDPAFLEPLLGDLIFVLCSEDDPVTGRVHDLSKLDAMLKDKRVFRIKLSHASHQHAVLARPAMFEVRVLSLRPDLAAVVAGERFRVVPQLATRLVWNENSIQPSELQSLELAVANELKKSVLDFEKSLGNNFAPYFKAGEARVFDRAVVVALGLDGSAVIDEAASSLKLSLPLPGRNSPLEATSPCRWNHARFIDWLIDRGENEAAVRGLVIVDARQANSAMAVALTSSAKKILKLQTGR